MKDFFRTHENHLKGNLQRESWITSIGKCKRIPQTPIKESIDAATKISKQNNNIWLCMSGGVDSEAMALAFVEAQVEFSVAILRFPEDLNDFDICHAVSFCDYYKLHYHFIDLDIFQFLGSDLHQDISHTYQCSSPQLCAHIHFLDQIPGCPVLSWNPPRITRWDNVSYITMPNFMYFSYIRYFEKKKREGIPFFFLYTPELIYSFIRSPLMQKSLIKDNYMQEYKEKCDIYLEGGFHIIPKEEKFTGFEKVKLEYDHRFNMNCYFDKKFRDPFKEKINEPKTSFCKWPHRVSCNGKAAKNV